MAAILSRPQCVLSDHHPPSLHPFHFTFIFLPLDWLIHSTLSITVKHFVNLTRSPHLHTNQDLWICLFQAGAVFHQAGLWIQSCHTEHRACSRPVFHLWRSPLAYSRNVAVWFRISRTSLHCSAVTRTSPEEIYAHTLVATNFQWHVQRSMGHWPGQPPSRSYHSFLGSIIITSFW